MVGVRADALAAARVAVATDRMDSALVDAAARRVAERTVLDALAVRTGAIGANRAAPVAALRAVLEDRSPLPRDLRRAVNAKLLEGADSRAR